MAVPCPGNDGGLTAGHDPRPVAATDRRGHIVVPKGASSGGRLMPRRPYPAWQRRHEAVLLYLLERPAARLDEVARATGYTRWQISRIVHSPEFARRYRAALDAAQFDAAKELVSGPSDLKGRARRRM